MAPHSSPGGPNQTLLELIFALKGLAQTIEFYHQDLTRRLDEEGKGRRADLERLRDLLAKSNQSLTVLPITLSDRVEKIVDNLEHQVDGRLDSLDKAVADVQDKLWQYTRSAERAISQNDGSVEAVPEKHEVTGRIELNDHGDINLLVNTKILKKLWYAVIVIATGGGAYGFVELLKKLFG